MARLMINGTDVGDIELAISPEEKKNGLMGVEWPPPLMAFPFVESEIRKFWMKDTPSPLDIVFCNDGKVVDIFKGEPFNENFIGPDTGCNLVVEAPVGFVEQHDISPGSKMRLRFEQDEIMKLLKWANQNQVDG